MKCEICKKETKTYFSFGKQICKECLLKRRKGIKGHSGMIYNPEVKETDYYIDSNKEVELVLTKKSHPLFVKWFIEHYPQSKGIVGRSINFLIYSYGKPIGIIGFASPPLNYHVFNKFFDFTDNNHKENAKKFLNNNVFRIIHTKNNLGTKVLKRARLLVKKIYKEKYGDDLKGLVTFVEKPRTGAVYKADNWVYLGETKGIEVKRRGENWFDKQYIKTDNKKLIFGYKYRK